MVIGLTISTFLVPTGVMITETCGWMNDFLSDEAEFNDPSYTFLEKEIMTKLSICKFGDGDLSEEYGIASELGLITELIDSLNVTLALEDDLHQRMKKHSEIRWSEVARKSIKQKLEILEVKNNLYFKIKTI